MPRVVHFEIAAEDTGRAVKFYREVFGWEASRWEGPFDYWLIRTGEEDEPGIDGAIITKDEMRGPGTTTNTIAVPSVDDYVERICRAGGKLIMPKREIAGVGFVAFCADTEGTVFGILEMEKGGRPE
jgi:predicted enzyme related to lactoylglutathione lyase